MLELLRSYLKLFVHSPHLLPEWDHTKNAGLDPDYLSHGSNRSCWWLCALHNHSYDSSVYKRTSGRGCPYCSGKRVLIGFNDLESQFPEIASQMSDEVLTPTTVTPFSGKKAQWVCIKGHRWAAPVSDRTGGHGCPACAGKGVAAGFNDLLHKNSDLASEIFDKSIDPTSISFRSHKVLVWVCSLGHTWEAAVGNRYRGDSCPFCSNRRVLRGFNDFESHHPNLVLEWADTSVSPGSVSPSSGKIVRWKCLEGHTWRAAINNRIRGSGCPKCCKSHTSKIEGRLRELLVSSGLFIYVDPEPNHRLNVPWGSNKTMRVDIFCKTLEGHKVVVEYDGEYFHGNGRDRDLTKTSSLLSRGYLVIRVRENKLGHLDMVDDGLLQLSADYSYSDANLSNVVSEISTWLCSY